MGREGGAVEWIRRRGEKEKEREKGEKKEKKN
jgi:hypothetical protein